VCVIGLVLLLLFLLVWKQPRSSVFNPDIAGPPVCLVDGSHTQGGAHASFSDAGWCGGGVSNVGGGSCGGDGGSGG
jgi:hypothetical protein